MISRIRSSSLCRRTSRTARRPSGSTIASLRADNSQKEYYLTDTLAYLRGKGLGVGIEPATHESELMGVNTAEQLAEVERQLLAAGVVPRMARGSGA